MDTNTVTHNINKAIACLRGIRNVNPMLNPDVIDDAIARLQVARAEVNGDHEYRSVPACAAATWTYP